MLDRGKTIIFIGVLYFIGILGAAAKMTYDQGAGVNKQESAVFEKDTETTCQETELESELESEADVEHRETESESEAETTQNQTETSSEGAAQEETESSSGEVVQEETETSSEETSQKETETSSEEAAQQETVTSGGEITQEQESESDGRLLSARVINVGKSGVNVRSSGSTDAKVIGLLREGEVVEVLEEVDGWYHIRKGDLEGYSFSEYLELMEQP